MTERTIPTAAEADRALAEDKQARRAAERVRKAVARRKKKRK